MSYISNSPSCKLQETRRAHSQTPALKPQHHASSSLASSEPAKSSREIARIKTQGDDTSLRQPSSKNRANLSTIKTLANPPILTTKVTQTGSSTTMARRQEMVQKLYQVLADKSLTIAANNSNDFRKPEVARLAKQAPTHLALTIINRRHAQLERDITQLKSLSKNDASLANHTKEKLQHLLGKISAEYKVLDTYRDQLTAKTLKRA